MLKRQSIIPKELMPMGGASQHHFFDDFDVRDFINICKSPTVIWSLLTIPAIFMGIIGIGGFETYQEMLGPTGEASVILLVAALAITPIRVFFAGQKWTSWLLKQRRAIGIAAAGYGALHVIFYLLDRGQMAVIWQEMVQWEYWTGWLAMGIFAVLALISNDTSMKLLKKMWKRMQLLSYHAAILVLLHWVMIEGELEDALAYAVPLGILEAYRIWKTRQNRQKRQAA